MDCVFEIDHGRVQQITSLWFILNGENFNSAGFASSSYDWNHAACGLHIPQCAKKKKKKTPHTVHIRGSHFIRLYHETLLQRLALSDIHKVCVPLGCWHFPCSSICNSHIKHIKFAGDTVFVSLLHKNEFQHGSVAHTLKGVKLNSLTNISIWEQWLIIS